MIIGRVLVSRYRDCGFEPFRRHCVVSLSKTRSTQEDLSGHNLKDVDWDVQNQIKENLKYTCTILDSD